MKLQSIQSLRGLAAFAVMVFHIRASEKVLIAAGAGTEVPMVGGLFTNGYFGVDLFFVISGFIMVFVAGASPATLRTASEFLFARLTRIYPVWWLFAALLAAYMLWTYGLSGTGANGTPAIGRGIPPIEYLVKSFLLAPQTEHPILGVGWTLVHEVHFYIVFALILLAPMKWRPWLLAIWAAFVIAGSLSGLSAPIAGTALQLATYPMTFEFILGAAAAYLVTSGRRWRPALVTTAAVFWLMFAAFFHGVETTFTLMWGRVLWFGLPCALLVYGFASLDIAGRLGALAPPVAGAVVAAIIFQAYGLPDPSHDGVRLQASLTALASGLAMCAVLSVIGVQMGRRMTGVPAFLEGSARLVKSVTVALGDWSYSLYLTHIFILHGMQQVFRRLAETPGSAGALFDVAADGRLGNLVFLFTCMAGAIMLSWLAYRFFEVPVTRQFSKTRHTLFHGHEGRVRPATVEASIW